ncbi:hypothetical protein FGIG_12325 [Fasciola gigantica]|uniref:Uncharacterized protein n=1 Tax=Fasciola gigantica TaxID=46835 RepID=A0A504YAI4_FASGI|nr:hypothetical protein FGIG_12325 [Fasciola gigantica]
MRKVAGAMTGSKTDVANTAATCYSSVFAPGRPGALGNRGGGGGDSSRGGAQSTIFSTVQVRPKLGTLRTRNLQLSMRFRLMLRQRADQLADPL